MNLYCCEHVLLQFGKREIHESFYCYIIILWVCNFPNIGNKVYHIKESFIANNLPRNYLHKKHIVMPSKLEFIIISFLYYIFIFLWKHLKKRFSKIFKFHMTNSVSVVYHFLFWSKMIISIFYQVILVVSLLNKLMDIASSCCLPYVGSSLWDSLNRKVICGQLVLFLQLWSLSISPHQCVYSNSLSLRPLEMNLTLPKIVNWEITKQFLETKSFSKYITKFMYQMNTWLLRQSMSGIIKHSNSLQIYVSHLINTIFFDILKKCDFSSVIHIAKSLLYIP